jgi:imidazolonepropionase-like amidohydrolase
MLFKPSHLLLSILLVAASLSANDQIPGELENVALVGGTVHTASGETLEQGVVIVRDGMIEAVIEGTDLPDPQGLTVLDVTGSHVYPGLFESMTQLGLVEIGAVRASRDQSELGTFNPNAQAHVSVNPDSELIPTVRANGVLLAHVHPSGGLVSGQSSVMRLDGWTYEDMTAAAPVTMVMDWPGMLPRQAWWIETSVSEQLKQRDERLARIEEVFDEAQRYKLAREAAGLTTTPTTRPAVAEPSDDAPAFDAKLEAMIPVLAGEVPLLITANEASEIAAAVAFTERRGLRLVIAGGQEAAKVADLLVEAEVPVIVQGVHRLPRGRDSLIDEAARLPGELQAAGVTFCIASNRAPAFHRNLPYHAAAAVPHGLDPADAVRSITLWPAQILGVADRYGSLEPGKSATLFVSDGDILEVASNVTHAWIDGRRVDLSSRHTELYEKYKRRLERD